MSVTFIIHFQVTKDKLGLFSDIMSSVKEDLPKIEGCLGVHVYRNNNEPQQYTLVETWASQISHQQHVKNLIDSGSWESMSALFDNEPSSAHFEEG